MALYSTCTPKHKDLVKQVSTGQKMSDELIEKLSKASDAFNALHPEMHIKQDSSD